MPTKRRRRTVDYINVRLSAIDDEDISEWWESQPEGAGGAAVKAAIRHYRDSASDSTPATRAELIEVYHLIEDQSRKLDAQDVTLRQLIMVIADLNRRLEAGITVNNTPAQPEQTEEQRLSETEQANRLNRIKGNKW